MSEWNSKNRRKFLLQYHLIFVCKYRKKLMIKEISDDIKQFSFEICKKYNVKIKEMETDKDHIHYLIETDTTKSISSLVNIIKSYTTFHIWKKHKEFLSRNFWKENTFWTDGYFVCSVGEASPETIRNYIANQG